MEIKAEPSLTGKGGQTTEPQAYQLSQICAWRPEHRESAVQSGCPKSPTSSGSAFANHKDVQVTVS